MDPDGGPVSRIVRSLSVPADLAGRRLDQAAAALLPEFSRSRLRTWIDAGELTVGGRAAKARLLLKGGEQLDLATELTAAVELEPEPIPLVVVHADDALLVIDKPVGLVVHPGAGNRSGTLQNALLHRYPELGVLPRAGLVHRLDKDTSGLLLVARTLTSHTVLSAALERREIKRTYRAICQGVLTGGGSIDAPIGRHRRERTKMAVTEQRPCRAHALSSRRAISRTHALRGGARNGAHASDSRAHGPHPRAAARRPRLWRTAEACRPRRAPSCGPRCKGSGARHCTRAGCDSPIQPRESRSIS